MTGIRNRDVSNVSKSKHQCSASAVSTSSVDEVRKKGMRTPLILHHLHVTMISVKSWEYTHHWSFEVYVAFAQDKMYVVRLHYKTHAKQGVFTPLVLLKTFMLRVSMLEKQGAHTPLVL